MIIRKLTLEDDLRAVAKLIYETDKYIYPAWFPNIDDALHVLPEIIKRDTLYSHKNTYVAVVDDVICGILIYMEKYPKNNYAEMLEAYRVLGLKPDAGFFSVNYGYFEEMDFAFVGTYILNICVDSNYQRRGIAGSLIDNLPLGEYSLAAVKDNINAVKLYEKKGFEYMYDYEGYSNVLCIEMKMKK